MRLRDLLTWRPARKGETPGTVEPADAPATDVDARPTFPQIFAHLGAAPSGPAMLARAFPHGWASCPDCGRPAGIGIYHQCRSKPPS